MVRANPASQVAPSAVIVRLAENVVTTVTRNVLDAANDHLVGAELNVALRESASAQVRHRLARVEVEFHVRAVGQLNLEPTDRDEAPRVLAFAALHDLLDEHGISDGYSVATV